MANANRKTIILAELRGAPWARKVGKSHLALNLLSRCSDRTRFRVASITDCTEISVSFNYSAELSGRTILCDSGVIFLCPTGTNLKRTKENILLMDSLKSLTNIMKERLLTTPYEQQEKKSYLADVIKREKKTNAAKEKLELKYNSAVKAKEAEVGITTSSEYFHGCN